MQTLSSISELKIVYGGIGTQEEFDSNVLPFLQSRDSLEQQAAALFQRGNETGDATYYQGYDAALMAAAAAERGYLSAAQGWLNDVDGVFTSSYGALASDDAVNEIQSGFDAQLGRMFGYPLIDLPPIDFNPAFNPADIPPPSIQIADDDLTAYFNPYFSFDLPDLGGCEGCCCNG